MPSSRSIQHSLKAGWVTSFGSGDELINFPIQSDQAPFPWVAPRDSTVAAYGRKSVNADGSYRYDGFLTVSWQFDYLTFGMLNYLWVVASGGSALPSLPAADLRVSILTGSATDALAMNYIQCLMHYPDVGSWAATYGGWKSATLQFTNGVLF